MNYILAFSVLLILISSVSCKRYHKHRKNHIRKNFERKKNCFPTIERSADAPKVEVKFYYETMCPDCYRWLGNVFGPAHEDAEFSKIIDTKFFPFGNGKIISENPPKFTCQHGEKECYGNMVHSCAVSIADQPKHTEFILCMEKFKGNSSDALIIKCASQSGIPIDDLTECYKGTQGPLELLKIAKATPEHEYVPWILLNNNLLSEDDYGKFVPEVCKLYTGELPKICNSYHYKPCK